MYTLYGHTYVIYLYAYMYLLIWYNIHPNKLFYIDEDGYFGQEQVPLTDEIKEILQEYPDGQIFKVSNCVCIIDYLMYSLKK